MTQLPTNGTTHKLIIELVATLKSLERYSKSKSVSESAKERLKQLKEYDGSNPEVLKKIIKC